MERDRKDHSSICESPKKRKFDETDDYVDKDYFSNFQVVRFLNENAQQKRVAIHGRFGESASDAVLILEKTPFNEETVLEVLQKQTKIRLNMQNDIYKTLDLYPHSEGIKSTLIYPATTKHLEKYASQKYFVVNESPEDYQQIVLPYIEASSFSHQWVYNILDKQSETERILLEDADQQNGFILVPDMKWNGKQVEDLYLVAIVHDRSLHSIRDLGAPHISLLEKIRDKGLGLIESKYGLERRCVRVYFHYTPSYYHLHVHFAHLGYEAPGISAGKAHLLDEVVDNLRLFGNYYKRKTLTYTLRENEELFQCYKKAGRM